MPLPGRYMSQPIRTKTVFEPCPACGKTTRMLARADWDSLAERWRHRRRCGDVYCLATWSLLGP